MGRPTYTAIIIIEEMPERYRGDYPILTVREFDDEYKANHFCQSFIKAPYAGGPSGPYKVRWQVVFGFALDSGEYGAS